MVFWTFKLNPIMELELSVAIDGGIEFDQTDLNQWVQIIIESTLYVLSE